MGLPFLDEYNADEALLNLIESMKIPDELLDRKVKELSGVRVSFSAISLA